MRVERLFESTALTPAGAAFDPGGADATAGAIDAVRSTRAARAGASARVERAQDRQTAALADRGAALARLGAATGAAARGLNDAALSVQRQRNAAARETALANARTHGFMAADTALREAREGAAPDGSDLEQRYSERVDEAHSELLSKVTDPDVRRAAEIQLGEVRRRYLLTARESADRQGRAYDRSQLEVRIADTVNRAVEMRGAEQELLLSIIADDIHRQAELGTIDPDVAQRKLAAARAAVAKATIGIDKDLDAVRAARRMRAGDYDHLFANDAEKIGWAQEIDRAGDQQRAHRAEALRGLIRDDLASRSATGRGVPGIETRLEAHGDADLLADWREAREAADRQHRMTQTIRWATPAQAVAAIEAERPEPGAEGFERQQKLYEAGVKAWQARQTALEDDPAGYVAANPRVRAADGSVDRGASIALQRALGVARPAWFSKEEAARAVRTYEDAPADEKIQVLAEVGRQAGANRNLALADLQDAGLPAEAMVLTMHADNPAMQAVVTRAVTAMGDGGKALRETLPAEAQRAVNEQVADSMADFRATVLASGMVARDAAGFAGRVQRVVSALAMSYAAQGVEPAEAARRAAGELINDHFAFAETYRVPAGTDPAQVRIATEALMGPALERFAALPGEPARLLATGEAVPPGGFPDDTAKQAQLERERAELRRLWLENLRANGTWVTSWDGEGLVLLDGDGAPVTNEAGRPFTLRFDNLPAADLARETERRFLEQQAP